MSCSRPSGASAPLSVVVLVVSTLLAGVGPARAAQAPKALSLDRLAEEATAVVLGTATRADSTWLEGQLVTLVDFAVEEHLAGSTAERIVILTVGGVDMNRRFPIAAVAPGEARLEAGRRSVLFLRPVEGGAPFHQELYVVVSGEQGEIAVSGATDETAEALTLGDLRAALSRHESSEETP